MALYSTVHCQYKWTQWYFVDFLTNFVLFGHFFFALLTFCLYILFSDFVFYEFYMFSMCFFLFFLLYLLLLFVCCLLSQKRKRKKSHGVEWVRRIWEDEDRKVRSEYIEWKTFFPEKQTNEQESYQCLRS